MYIVTNVFFDKCIFMLMKCFLKILFDTKLKMGMLKKIVNTKIERDILWI